MHWLMRRPCYWGLKLTFVQWTVNMHEVEICREITVSVMPGGATVRAVSSGLGKATKRYRRLKRLKEASKILCQKNAEIIS